MAYIETHQSLLTHRKTLRLSRLLGIDRWATAGRLMALWSWALDNAQEGIIQKADSDILADIMGWPVQWTSSGHPNDIQNSDAYVSRDVTQQLVEALVSAGFLDEFETHYAIHDWWDYAGKLIEKRKADAERKRRERANSGQASPVQRTSSGRPTDVAGTVPKRTAANRTVPYQDLSSGESYLSTDDDDETRARNGATPAAAAAAASELSSASCWTDTELREVGKRIIGRLKLPASALDGLVLILQQYPHAPPWLEGEAAICADWCVRNRKKPTLAIINSWLLKARKRQQQQSQQSQQAHTTSDPLAAMNGKESHNGTTGQQPGTYDPATDEAFQARRRSGAKLVRELAELETGG